VDNERQRALIALSLWISLGVFIAFYYINILLILFLSLIIFNTLLRVRRWLRFLFEGLTSFVLAFLFIQGFYLLHTKYIQFGICLSSLCLYYITEYLFVCTFHYNTLSWNSFLINQSKYFIACLLFSFSEFFLEFFLFGDYKILKVFIVIGSIGLIIGQSIRITTLFTAGKNFHHNIQHEFSPDHRLLTTGLYSFTRHPSYLGWYIWAMSSQVLMVNPVSFYVYWIACRLFLNVRVNYEEETLIKLFRNDYLEYMKKVPTRIPYVPGINLNEYEKSKYKANRFDL